MKCRYICAVRVKIVSERSGNYNKYERALLFFIAWSITRRSGHFLILYINTYIRVFHMCVSPFGRGPKRNKWVFVMAPGTQKIIYFGWSKSSPDRPTATASGGRIFSMWAQFRIFFLSRFVFNLQLQQLFSLCCSHTTCFIVHQHISIQSFPMRYFNHLAA